MIVRIAHFRFPDEDHRAAAELNGSQRVWPALASQPGAHAIYYGRTGDLEAYSISVWEDHAKGEAAGAFMNSRPLLPEQTPEMLPTPDAVTFYDVVSSLERDPVPAAGRIGHLRRAPGLPARPPTPGARRSSRGCLRESPACARRISSDPKGMALRSTASVSR